MNNMVVDHTRPETVECPVERRFPIARGSAQHDAEATVLRIGQENCQLPDDPTRHFCEDGHMPTAPHFCGICLAQKLIDVLRLLTKQFKTAYCIPLSS